MEKEFVPYEQALELNYLGFEEKCFGKYYYIREHKAYNSRKGEDVIFGDNNRIILRDTPYSHSYDENEITVCVAPLWQQAFKWILEKHSIYCLILPTITMDWTFKTMTVVSDMIEVPPYSHVHHTDYSTREEAELECLKRLIEMVKDK